MSKLKKKRVTFEFDPKLDVSAEEAIPGEIVDLKKCISCLKEVRSSKNIEENSLEGSTVTLYDALREVFDFKIVPDENHPRELCRQCEIELKITYGFKKKIQNSDLIYRNQLATVFLPVADTNGLICPKVELYVAETPIKSSPSGDAKKEDQFLNLSENTSSLRKRKKILYKTEESDEENVALFSSDDNSNDGDFIPTGFHDGNSTDSDDEMDMKLASFVTASEKVDLNTNVDMKLASFVPASVKDEVNTNVDMKPTSFVPANKKDEVNPNVNTNRNTISVVNGTFACSICPNKFLYQKSLDEHMKTHEKFQKDRECPICHRIFYSSSYIKEHMLRNHPDPNSDTIKCVQCKNIFTTNEALKEHMKTHELEKKNICKHCKEKFDDNDTLKRHVMEMHSPFECGVCGKHLSRKSIWIAHQRSHKLHKPYGCTECPKKFCSADLLRVHRFCIHRNIRFDCMYCIQKFTARRFLLNHIKIHHTIHEDEPLLSENVKPYPHACNLCTLRFKEANDLEQHDCKPNLKHDCNQCSKRFPLRSQLKLHLRNDHDNVLEKCKKCNEMIKRKKLERHMRTHAPGYKPTRSCPHCFKDIIKKNFEKHLIIHQPGYVPTNPVATSYKCSECNRTFFRESNYIKHIQRHKSK